jgi:carboxyl-terminal processing protease
MKVKRRSFFRAIEFVLLGSVVIGGFRAGAVNFQDSPPASPKYVPPACQGKPLTVVPREVALAQSPTEVKKNPTLGKDEQLKLFDAVVKIINDVYVYPDFNGANWPGVVVESRARVASGLDTETFYAEMEKLVLKLGDEHSHFDSPVKVTAEKAALSGVNNYVGIGALFKPMPEKKLVSILAIIPDSSAEHSGLQQHDALLAVDGLAVVVDGKVYQQRTRGPECSVAVLKVQSPGTLPRDVTLVRSQVVAPVPIYARLVKTTDNSRIGYIFLPSFFDLTFPEQVKKALGNLTPLDGLIIDNRMNTGGSSKVLLPILGYFTSGTVGHLVSRTARRPLEIGPDPVGNSQRVPLVILVSHDTVSYGEIFSGVLKDIGRARIVGQTTAGRTETLHGYNFPDGSQAWIAQERFDPINSHLDWKRQGIKPDVEVYADWDTFTFENDPAVAKAVTLLRNK